jgi:peptide/nickel transport system ATP-binding protein
MYLGRLIEYGSARQIFGAPAHPYTLALLSAIPKPGVRASRIIASGELPNPLSPPSGCAYRGRCFKAQEICARIEPEMVEHSAPGHLSACHFAASDYAD